MRIYVVPGVNTLAFAVMVLWGIPILASVGMARRKGRRAWPWAMAAATWPLSIFALLLIRPVAPAEDIAALRRVRRLDVILGPVAAMLSTALVLVLTWRSVTDEASGVPRCDSDTARASLARAGQGQVGYAVYFDLTDLGGAPDGMRHCSATVQISDGERAMLHYNLFKGADGRPLMSVRQTGPFERAP